MGGISSYCMNLNHVISFKNSSKAVTRAGWYVNYREVLKIFYNLLKLPGEFIKFKYSQV